MGRILRTLALTLALAGGGLGLGASPAGAETLRGYGRVLEVDAAAGQLTVDDRVFRVSATTRILDLDERALALAELPVRGDAPGSHGQTEPGAVRYEVVRAGGELVATRIELVEAVPR